MNGMLPGQPRMAQRVAGAIDNAAPPGNIPPGDRIPTGAVPGKPRVLEGIATSNEFDEMGIPLAPWQRIALDATDPAQTKVAEQVRWAHKLAGNDFPEVMASQRQAFTDIVKREAGLEGVPNLTPVTVSNALGDVGAQIGQFRTAKGAISFEQEALDRIKGIADEALSTHQGALSKVVADIEKSMGKTGGVIDPADANSIMTRLNDLTQPGGSATYSQIKDAKAILKEFNDELEKGMSTAEVQAYKDAMYKYRVLKTLDRTGAVSADGIANPVSFGRGWDKRTAQTLRGKDPLGRWADTFASIGVIRETPGSTMQRVFASAPGLAKRHGATTVGSVMGSGLATSLMGAVLGL
jgi:hypothetical protein